MKRIIYTIIFIVIGAGIISLWYSFALSSRANIQTAQVFTIATGESTATVAARLKKSNLIDSALAFKVYFYFNREKPIQAGEYIIEAKTRAKDIIAQLEKGEIAERETSVLIREGLSVKDINAYLKEKGYVTDDSFLKAGAKYEGYLFPDTYRMFKNFSATDLIEKMRANFEKKLSPELREAMQKSGHSPEDIIIMASLLEKEVRSEEDMKIVSGIFWDRVAIGQGLQSCATLAYILGVNKAQYSYEDTQLDSAYNTYKHRGLPPGPISNPGLKAIKAAIYPTKTDYNYFLSRPDTGETVFSKTLDEHNAAKSKYLK